MFAQVIRGTVTDQGSFEKQALRWRDELRPGAIGFLGSTGGVTDDGKAVIIARFASAEEAAANNDRPEQGEWWTEAEGFITDVTFQDSTDVVLQGDGGSDEAGFVQIMAGHITDVPAYDRMVARMPEFIGAMKDFRDDILGGVTVRFPDDTYVDVIYFTSEEAARDGEGKQLPPELEKDFSEMMGSSEVDEFLDLRAPLLW